MSEHPLTRGPYRHMEPRVEPPTPRRVFYFRRPRWPASWLFEPWELVFPIAVLVAIVIGAWR